MNYNNTENTRTNFSIMGYNANLDFVRTFAIFCVIGVHAFRDGHISFLQGFIRGICMIGVPLFLMLTGYLNSKKTIDDYFVKGKWKRCIEVYIAYVILGSVCYLVANHFCFSPGNYIEQLLAFKLTSYGWYIDMWLGLFFLTPFLNIILNHLNGKEERIMLIVLSTLSLTANFFNRNGHVVIPDFWIGLFPLTYYVIGHYLRCHFDRYKTMYCRLLLLVVVGLLLVEPTLNELFPSDRYLYYMGGHDSLGYAIYATIAFILMLYMHIGKMVSKVLKSISSVSLYMYLISNTFDIIAFRITGKEGMSAHVKCFVFSLLLSYLIGIVYKYTFAPIIKKIINKNILEKHNKIQK